MKIFFCYKKMLKQDEEIALEIASAVEAAGYDVVVGKTGVSGNSESTQIILHRLALSDAMVCLISNAALNSKQVLYEIGRALKAQKPVIPILLEDLEFDLYFRAFGPHFIDRPHIRYSGDVSAAVDGIIGSLAEAQDPGGRNLIKEVLAEYDVKDYGEILYAMLGLLRDLHMLGRTQPGSKPAESAQTESATAAATLTVALTSAVAKHASISKKNAKVYRSNGLAEPSARLEATARGATSLKKMLRAVIESCEQPAPVDVPPDDSSAEKPVADADPVAP